MILLSYDKKTLFNLLITTGDLALSANGVLSRAVIHVMGELRPCGEVICTPLYSDCRLILNYRTCKWFCPDVGF